MAQKCLHCSRRLPFGAMRYLVSDLGEEMLAWVELNLKCEVTERSCLCEECFTSFRSSWSAVQEDKVLALPIAMEGMSSDPLSGEQLPVEEIKVEQPEHLNYDYEIKLEDSALIDTTDESDDNKIDMKIDHEFSALMDSTLESNDDTKDTLMDNTLESNDDTKDTKINQETSSDDDIPLEESSDDEWRPKGNIKPMQENKIPQLHKGTSFGREVKCAWCSIQLNMISYRRLQDEPEDGSKPSPQRVCNDCWQQKYAKDSSTSQSKCSITLPGYKRTPKSSSCCFIIGCTTKDKSRKRIPDYLRRVLLKSYNIFVSEKARSCEEHIKEYNRDWNFLKQQPLINYFSTEDVTEMLDLLRDYALKLPE